MAASAPVNAIGNTAVYITYCNGHVARIKIIYIIKCYAINNLMKSETYVVMHL